MYRTSKDRRFQKNKRELRRAFLELVMERGYQKLTISDITARADVNRMTFYSHYDAVEDIFREFVDDMEKEIADRISEETEFSMDGFIAILNSVMYREIDFFRYVAKTDNCAEFKTAFKDSIGRLIQIDLSHTDPGHTNPGMETHLTDRQQKITSDLCAVCIAWSYLDWLAGEYGAGTSLDEVMKITKQLLRDQLPWVSYRRSLM